MSKRFDSILGIWVDEQELILINTTDQPTQSDPQTESSQIGLEPEPGSEPEPEPEPESEPGNVPSPEPDPLPENSHSWTVPDYIPPEPARAVAVAEEAMHHIDHNSVEFIVLQMVMADMLWRM